MLRNFTSHLLSLHRFGGREGVKAFWTYLMFVIVAQLWALSMVMLVPIWSTLGNAAERAGSKADLTPLAQQTALIAVLSIVLTAAALVRRLHDTGRSGLWGLLPVPFLGAGLYLLFGLAEHRKALADPGIDPLVLFLGNAAIYLICLGVLAYFSIRPGDSGANSFGAPPRNPRRL